MLYKSEKIKLLIGLLIVASIFVFIGISTYFEKAEDYDSLLNFEENYSSDIPENYLEEVVDVFSFDAHLIMIDKSEKIVGFSIDSDAATSFNNLKEQLISRGWNYVDSGSSTSSSFYKNNGNYKWLFVNCVNVGGETSVVLTVD